MVKAIALRRKWWIYTLLGLLLWTTSAVAQAKACGSNATWTFTEQSLQNARQRVKSDAHKSAVSRVRCGKEIIEAIGRPEQSSACESCVREYVGMLQDVIAFTRYAAEHTASKENEKRYYDSEIQTRLVLGRFLLDTKNKDFISRYWRENFEGLGDAAERAKMGERFHQEASQAAQEQMLSPKSFRTWAKAVRSCESWNFVDGESRDLAKLRKILLCAEDCRAALTRIRNRAAKGEGIDRENIEEDLAELLPALDRCPTEPSP